MILKQQLKNVVLVTNLQKMEYYGTNAEVMEFGCLKCVAGGTLFMVIYGIFASRWPSFLKFFILIKFYIGFFFINEILFFVVMQFFVVVLWYLLVITEVAMEMWSCDITPVKFCSVAAELSNFFCWYISEQGYCPLQVGVLRIPVSHCVLRDTSTVSQCEQENETFIAEADLCICHIIAFYCLCTLCHAQYTVNLNFQY